MSSAKWNWSIGLLIALVALVGITSASFAFELSGDPRLPSTVPVDENFFAEGDPTGLNNWPDICRAAGGTYPSGRYDAWYYNASGRGDVSVYIDIDGAGAGNVHVLQERISEGYVFLHDPGGYTLTRFVNDSGTAPAQIMLEITRSDYALGNSDFQNHCVPVYDSTPPRVDIENAPVNVNSLEPFSVTFEFSEDVTGFVVGDVTVGNGAASNFVAVNGNSYTADITPDGNGDVSIDVDAGVAEDAAGNGNTAATQAVSNFDNTPPTVEIQNVPAISMAPFNVTFQFSEDVTGFAIDDITLGNATAANFAAVNGNSYTADITPASDGQVTIDVAAGVAQDAAGNGNTAATQAVSNFDNTAPTVEIQNVPAISMAPFNVTFQFSEDVTGFAIDDITLGNATAANFVAVNGNSYTADITPASDGPVTIDVAAGVAEDAARNGNTAATQAVSNFDNTAPTVEIQNVPAISMAPFNVTFQFSEDVTGFAIDDITLGNATAANFAAVNANSYTADITPASDGQVTIDVAAGVAEDAAGNGNTAATQAVSNFDNTAPTVEIQNVPAISMAPFNVTFQFSEDVTGFAIDDITLGNATAANFVTVNGNSYTADITPASDGQVTIDVAAGVAQDAARNGNTAATQAVSNFDNTAPTVEIQNAPDRIADLVPFNVTFEFSEDVTGFVLADLTIGNGSASNFVAVDGNTYTADITPSGNGDVTIDVAAGVAKDTAGNGNTAADRVTVINTIVEYTQQVIARFMLNRANHILNNQPDLIGFIDGIGGMGGGPLGRLTLNGNESGLILAFATSLGKIDGEANRRIIQTLGTAPGADGGEQAGDSTVTFNSASARKFDIWTRVYGSMSRSAQSESSLWVGYFGAHYFVSPDMLVGGLLQLDWANETDPTNNSSADGFGWMIGPYIAGRVFDQGLYYEARASWGKSDNNVSPFGTYNDNFVTERWMASAKISGSYKLDALTIKPVAKISWFEETQANYFDSLTNLIPSQTISLGELRFGPSFNFDMKLENGILLQPMFGVSGVWNFGINDNQASQGFALGNNALRAWFGAGIAITDSNGWSLIAGGYYDGVGVNDYRAWGGNIQLTIPFN